ncbi:hypothetical protein GCM10009772_26720 [Pseudonocardia alni subsp. carboxydivorans]
MARVWIGPDDEPSRGSPARGDRPSVDDTVTRRPGPVRPPPAAPDRSGAEVRHTRHRADPYRTGGGPRTTDR